jgi:predicted permease
MLTDARRTLRDLVRDPGFTALAVLVFGLTIGATIGVFAIVDAVLLQPTAFARPDRTVVVWERDVARNSPVVEVALGEVNAWQRQTQLFDAVAVFGSVNWTLTLIDGASHPRLPYASVSAAFFPVVGVAPILGRALDARDEAGPAPATAVISHRMWQQHFAGDPGVLGRVLRVVEGDVDADAPPTAVEIVGVMPADFDFPRGAMLWTPAAPSLRTAAGRDDPEALSWYLERFKVFYAIGRLRDGVSVGQAALELRPVAGPDGPRDPASTAPDVVVTPVDDYLVGAARPVLWLMLAGGLLMVLLACSSVASLQVFRASRNDRALAIQLALGASRAELMRRALIESAVLAVAGALTASVVAWAVTRALVAAAPIDVPRLSSAAGGQWVAVTALVVVVALLTSVWPALFVTRVDTARTLTTGTRTAMHPRERRWQRLVVGSQVAVAVIVLAGAGLFVRSVQRLEAVPLGFAPAGLLSVAVEPLAAGPERWDQFYDTLLERTRALQGVQGAAAVYLRPLSGPIGMDTLPVREDQAGLGPDAPWRQNPRVNLEAVTPGYFGAIGTPLIAGRDFTAADVSSSTNVVIVGESTAARLWPGRSPIGERMLVPTQRQPGSIEQPRWQTVVGVAGDVRYRGLTDPRLDVYIPAAQSTMRVKHLLVRSAAGPEAVAGPLRAIVRELDPAARFEAIDAMADVVARESAPWRFAMRVLGGFGLTAVAVAAAGLTGLVSLVVALRRRELGIRSALGATPARLRWHVMSDAIGVIAAGAAAGVVMSAMLGRAIAGLLVETQPADPVALVSAAALAAAAGLIGCLRPAHRASGREPVDAIRE